MSMRMLRWIAASVTSLILALTVGTAAYAQEPTITRLADGNYQITQDGSALTGWQTVDGRPFYLDSNGIQHIGWLEIDGATSAYVLYFVLFSLFFKMSIVSKIYDLSAIAPNVH